ncbi:LOW QUALITY PROTEIN: hypothetical protein Syun_018899 [Stephania yunnanensis]|uniref:Protein kinase domain-containing protein n=1 Tax=Stephania yunnanensis TaxID=152371 RepID=A0AAP0NVF3_9MAGN
MGIFSCNSEHSIIACDPYNKKQWKKKNNNKKKKSQVPINETSPIRRFDYSDLEAGTDGFSAESFLGKGSHGSVYRAVLEQGSLVVAVKKMSSGDGNGDVEIEILSRIRSPLFVNILGFSLDCGGNKLIVVEFMGNGSLFELLHSESRRPPRWAVRVRLAVQIAEAVAVLHSSKPPVIHRDIKSSNVLIDGKFNARLGDFGLALRGNVEDVRVRGTPPAGTLGYIDPGYVVPENLSPKSDVFSFGILLLEIISGRNAIDLNYSPSSVVDWALPKIKHGEFMELCDARIGAPPGGVSVVRKLGVLAARCVSSVAEKRPAMEEVVERLRVVNKAMSESSLTLEESYWANEERIREFDGMLDDSIEGSFKSPRQGIRRTLSVRNRRRVSSIQTRMNSMKDQTSSIVGDRVNRSNSIGSTYEIKFGGSDTSFFHDRLWRARMKKGVTVRMPAVKLSRSRSLDNQRGYVFQLVRKSSNGNRGLDELKQSSCSILLNKEVFSSTEKL